jgi:hypothetical protein
MNSITINEDKTIATIDGVVYTLTPGMATPEPKKPELKTFRDCWDKVKPNFVINSNNCIINGHTWDAPRLFNYLPTEKTARQIQAAIKLFVVWTAVNGEGSSHINENVFYIFYSRYTNDLTVTESIVSSLYNQYPFKTKELAQKAIDIAKDIWLEYFGIENQK